MTSFFKFESVQKVRRNAVDSKISTGHFQDSKSGKMSEIQK
jgi:hypothetical protein